MQIVMIQGPEYAKCQMKAMNSEANANVFFMDL